MDADWSVEIGGDAPALEFPWRAPQPHGPQYVDLKRHPELIESVAEAVRYPELREFLRAVNLPASSMETAKCDVWTTTELGEEERVYGAWKCGCYVDLLFSGEKMEARFSFDAHERLARMLADRIGAGPEVSASAELIVRRCYYHATDDSDATDLRAGFYLTLYVSGYGDDEADARRNWGLGLYFVATTHL